MCQTVENLRVDVPAGLGSPDLALLDSGDVLRAVIQSLKYYYQALAQSQAVNAVRRHEFHLSGSEYNLSGVGDFGSGLGAFVERALDSSGSLWEYVPTTNLDSLQDFRLRGEPAVAFVVELGQPQARFSYDATETPSTRHQVFYHPLAGVAATGATELPHYFNEMASIRAQLDCLPLMVVKAAQKMEGLTPEELAPQLTFYNATMTAWGQLRQRLEMRLQEWERQFDRWLRAPYGQRGRNLRPVRPRNSVAQRAYGSDW